MKKTIPFIFVVITAIIFYSCTKDESESSKFTGYYNSKSIYQNDLLLRTVSATGTSSFFGSGAGTDLNINTSLYVDKTNGVKTIIRISKTLDSIRVYDLDKPELGGLLYVTKDNNVSVHDFEFVGSKNKINTTFNYGTFPVPAGKYNLSSTNNNEAESIIDKAIEKFNKFTQTLGGSEILDSIKESLSKAKENAINNFENAKQSIKELSNYLNKTSSKNPEPIKLSLNENPINQDEQKVINENIEEPFDCSKSTLAMTISEPKITNGIASVTANGIGGVGKHIYKWSDGQDGDHVFFSKSGTYTVTITDSNGCSISSSVLVIIELDCSSSTLAVTTTATANSTTVIATGGLSPYSYLWSNGSTSDTATNFPPGTYSVKVTDAQGCNISLNGIVFCDEKTIRIGTQCWGKTNLDVSNYRNGDPIPEVTDEKEWGKLTTGAWCYFKNDAANGAKYGKLYNKYALNDPRGLAPAGYHIATSNDFFSLIAQFGGVNAGGKLKATTDWKTPNTGATNSSNFTALPGGFRYSGGQFSVSGESGDWWGGLSLTYNSGNNSNGVESNMLLGKSIRCVKD